MWNIILTLNLAIMPQLVPFKPTPYTSLWFAHHYKLFPSGALTNGASSPNSSVNSGISASSYLNEPYKLRLPGIDRLCQFILQHGRGCLLYKKDLQRAYRQLPIDPKDYNLLGFPFNGRLYFDTRCPFGLRTSAMICQRTTSAVIYIFTQRGYTADVYLDEFYHRQPRRVVCGVH